MSAIARSSFILIECILLGNIMNEIIQIFGELEAFFTHSLCHQICYREFAKKYRQRAYFVIACALIYYGSFIVRFIIKDKGAGGPALFTKVLQLITLCSYIHFLFFIDLMSFQLKQLNSVVIIDIKCLASGTGSELPLRNRLKYYKILYFRLWIIKKRVSRYFGYSLITILLDTFDGIVYSVLWIYQNAHRDLGLPAIWSKL